MNFPLLAPHDPYQIVLENKFTPPLDGGHLLGTDALGRDVLSRMIHGTRISLVLGVLVCLMASIIGIVLGTISGYFGSWADPIIMRVADVVLAFPFLILAIAVMAIFQQPSLTLVFDTVSVTGAILPSVTYRFSSNFSLTVGMAAFLGDADALSIGVDAVLPGSNHVGPLAYTNEVERGLAPIRDRDEIYLRIRYTF